MLKVKNSNCKNAKTKRTLIIRKNGVEPPAFSFALGIRVIKVLNAELKAVYGIKLAAANSHDSSHLKLLLDADLMRLANISDFFTCKPNGQVQPTVDNSAGILPL